MLTMCFSSVFDSIVVSHPASSVHSSVLCSIISLCHQPQNRMLDQKQKIKRHPEVCEGGMQWRAAEHPAASFRLIRTHNQSFVLQKNDALWLLSDTFNYCCAINRQLNRIWHHQSCCGQRNMTISLLRRYRKEHVFQMFLLNCKRTHESIVIIQ